MKDLLLSLPSEDWNVIDTKIKVKDCNESYKHDTRKGTMPCIVPYNNTTTGIQHRY